MNTIGNGDFESSVLSTHDPALIIHGGYWNNAEGKVEAVQKDGATTRALRLEHSGDHVIQRFPAFEYVAQGVSEGLTQTMTVSGRVQLTDLDVEAQVIVEEAPLEYTAASWGLRDPGATDLVGRWKYLSYVPQTGEYEEMTFVDNTHNVNDYYYGDFGAEIRLDYQVAGYSTNPLNAYGSALRAWVVPRTGWVQIQCRAARYPFAAHPQKVPGGSDVVLRITTRASEESMALHQTLATLSVDDSDGVLFSQRIRVIEGQVLAFETTEEGTPATGPSARIMLDPIIHYDSRRVVYRIGHDLDSEPSTPETHYPAPIHVSSAGVWQDFTLNVGSDYVSHFDEDECTHGPVPQLSLRLELTDGASQGDVYFDDVSNSVAFWYPSRSELNDDICDELDRTIDNWFEYGIRDMDEGQAFYHPYVRRNFSIVDGEQLSLISFGFHRSLAPIISEYSKQYFHTLATTWLVYQTDAIVQNRDRRFGMARRYDFGTGEHYDWSNGETVQLYGDVRRVLEMYDLTGDITYLDMAYECGVSILAYGKDPGSDLYTTRFKHRGSYLEPIYDDVQNPVTWSRATHALAYIAGRVGETPALLARYSSPGAAEFLTAAKDAAAWVTTNAPGMPAWHAYWLNIEREMDDFLGYNSHYFAESFDVTGDTFFRDQLEVGSDIFFPEWVQTFDRGTLMNGDQERSWPAYLHYFKKNPDPLAAGSTWKYGQAYVEALLYQLRGSQIGNGVWTAGNTHLAQFPGLVAAGTPLAPADTHKLRPIVTAFMDEDLATYGLTDGTMIHKEDLYALYATIFKLNRRHYGEYISGENQVGYMSVPAFPNPVLDIEDLPLTAITAGREFRALTSAPLMLAAIEADQSVSTRPVVEITPDDFGYETPTQAASMVFEVTDSAGLGDLTDNGILVRITEIDPDTNESLLDTILEYDPDAPGPVFEELFDDGTTVRFGWKSGSVPYLAADKNYRFSLSAIDNERRWDIDTVLYEIRP